MGHWIRKHPWTASFVLALGFASLSLITNVLVGRPLIPAMVLFAGRFVVSLLIARFVLESLARRRDSPSKSHDKDEKGT